MEYVCVRVCRRDSPKSNCAGLRSVANSRLRRMCVFVKVWEYKENGRWAGVCDSEVETTQTVANGKFIGCWSKVLHWSSRDLVKPPPPSGTVTKSFRNFGHLYCHAYTFLCKDYHQILCRKRALIWTKWVH